MKYRTLIIVCMFAFLYGCDNTPKEQTMTVDWFKEHKAEREAKLTECKNNPGELMVTPNCINAQKAASSITWSAKGNPTLVPLTAEQLKRK